MMRKDRIVKEASFDSPGVFPDQEITVTFKRKFSFVALSKQLTPSIKLIYNLIKFHIYMQG
jgi:hypothetical protein